MKTTFKTEAFRPTDTRPAYALIRGVVPGLSLAKWTRYARRTARPGRSGRSGIRVVRGAKSYPVGLVCYRVEDDLLVGQILRAHHFVALELLEARPVLTALVEGLDALAMELGCNTVESLLHGPDTALDAWFEKAGHSRSGIVYRKAAGEMALEVAHDQPFGPAGATTL